MAVSIVSNPFGDDNSQPSTNTIPSQDGIVSSVAAQDIAVEENTSPVENGANETIQTQDAVATNDDGQRLNDLHPEQVTSSLEEETKQAEEKTESIPNMYIKADTENTLNDVPADVAIFSEEPKKEDVG